MKSPFLKRAVQVPLHGQRVFHNVSAIALEASQMACDLEAIDIEIADLVQAVVTLIQQGKLHKRELAKLRKALE